MNVSKRRLISLLTASLMGIPSAHAAANLNDYLTHGYRIAVRTSVVGIFKGCEKDRQIQLRDKSIFNCDARSLHQAYAPTAFILQTTDVPARYAVLIDGQTYTGSLSTLSGKKLKHALPVSAFTQQETASIVTARPLVATMPLMPIVPKQAIYPQPNE